MSNSLQSKIETIASDFAAGLMEIILSSPLEEIVGARAGVKAEAKEAKEPKGSKPAKKGRLARRSEEDIADVVQRIVTLLAKKPNGMRAEELREKLGIEAKELPRPLADAMAAKLITKSGNKRATTYFAKEAKPAKAKKAAKPAKAKKKAAKAKPAKKAKTKKAAKKATEAAETSGEV